MQGYTSQKLTVELEFDFAERIKAGDRAARFELALTALPIVKRSAAHFARPGVDREDLISEGLLAAAKVAETFAPTKGRYLTLVPLYIDDAIKMFMNSNKAAVHIPKSAWGNRAGSEHLLSAADSWTASANSLNDTVRDSDGASVESGDLVADADSAAAFEAFEAQSDASSLIEKALADPRMTAAQVKLIRVVLAEPDLAGDALADRLGMKRAGVSRLKDRAFSSMREILVDIANGA